MVATASQRQLHAGKPSRDARPWRREAVWGRSPRRTMAPNESEPLSKPDRPGERVSEREAQNPTEAGAVRGAGVMGHSVFLLREIHVGPQSGRLEEGNDNRTKPTGKSDLSILATKSVKAGGAKGEMD